MSLFTSFVKHVDIFTVAAMELEKKEYVLEVNSFTKAFQRYHVLYTKTLDLFLSSLYQ